MSRIRPEFNHGGVEQLPPVNRSLRWVHTSLVKQGSLTEDLAKHIERCAFYLELSRLHQAFKERLHVAWLRTPWGRLKLSDALDLAIIRDQLGTDNLQAYRRHFLHQSDLRPHPLISPEHLNRERLRRCLPPIKNADDLFRHLLYPDMLPLNTHPWFDCLDYQIQTGQVGSSCCHPILSYLREKKSKHTTTTPSGYKAPWLIALGAHLDKNNEKNLPEVISRLHPGLVLADPQKILGDPSQGPEQIIANEKYLREIQELFDIWPESDPELPLTWLNKQPNVEEIGLTEIEASTGYQLWWVSGHWESRILAQVAGVERRNSREFMNPKELYEELHRINIEPAVKKQRVLIALTAPLLELFFKGDCIIPYGVIILNLVWPKPTQQSAWLHLLARAKLVLECRAEVRAFLQGIGLKAVWSRPNKQDSGPRQINGSTLLLALDSGLAEAQLAAAAPSLNAERYDAVLRIDAELQLQNPLNWLEEKLQSHTYWVWLNELPLSNKIKAHAVVAWAKHHGVNIKVLTSATEERWWRNIKI